MEEASGEIRSWRIRGRVQGVGFRWWTRNRARELGLGGWVRNLPDGSVEVEAWGDPGDLEALDRVLAEGPPHAMVTEVERGARPGSGAGREFRIR